MSITRGTSAGWIQDLDAVTVARSIGHGWLQQTASAPPPAGNVLVWNGSAHVSAVLKVWNGSAFVEKPLKTWNGTTWVTA